MLNGRRELMNREKAWNELAAYCTGLLIVEEFCITNEEVAFTSSREHSHMLLLSYR